MNNPCRQFFEPWDLPPRLHPGGLPGLFRWKMKAFWAWLLYSGSIEVFGFRFSDGLSGFWSKRVSEQSQSQFYQSYWVENYTGRSVSYTNRKMTSPS